MSNMIIVGVLPTRPSTMNIILLDPVDTSWLVWTPPCKIPRFIAEVACCILVLFLAGWALLGYLLIGRSWLPSGVSSLGMVDSTAVGMAALISTSHHPMKILALLDGLAMSWMVAGFLACTKDLHWEGRCSSPNAIPILVRACFMGSYPIQCFQRE